MGRISFTKPILVSLIFMWGSLILMAQTPEPLWKRAVGGKITSWQAQGPDGKIYLVADDRALHAIDPKDGSDKWFYRPGGRLTDFLAVSADGTIYIQNRENQIFAVNPGGDARWKCNVGGLVRQLPALTPDGTIIFLLDRGVMAALSRKGEILWTVELGGEPTASPVIDYRGQVYVALAEGVLCYNREGERLWSLGAEGTVQLAVDRKGRLYGVTELGRIRSFDSDGQLLWDTGTEPGTVTTLALRNEDVLIQTDSGLIFRANNSGSESFYQGAKPLTSGYLSREGNLCFFDEANQLISLNFEKGIEEILFTSPAVPSLPLVTRGGQIFFGGSDWRFYSYFAPQPDTGWSQFRANQRRDGSLYAVLSPYEKEAIYKDDKRWLYYNYLTQSDDPQDQMDIVDQVRSYGRDRSRLEEDIPFWDLILMNLTESRDGGRFQPGDEGYTDDPVVRAEAYHLLGEWAVFPARNTIIAHMKQEADPLVLASACFSLGEISSDWDGQSTAAIGGIVGNRKYQKEPRLMLEAGRALEKIMLYNGGETAETCWEYWVKIQESPHVSREIKDALYIP